MTRTSWGVPCTACDAKTTTPVLLGPGDVFVNADFGYQPGAGTFGSIGDTVWLDADRNNAQNGSEPGLPGVTVSLIKDLDGDGTWNIGEPIIATTITGDNPATVGVVETGWYQFTGLPVGSSADYLVWVNDTNYTLHELTPTYDVLDGANQTNPTTGVVTGLTISRVSDLTTAPVTNADFAYAPPGHDAGEGLIGDTIFLDRNPDGLVSAGEGLEGVQVELIASDGRLVGRTVTNEAGLYFFGGLPAGTYTVRVVTTTLPNNGTGLTNTVDPDTTNPGNSQSSVVLAAAGGQPAPGLRLPAGQSPSDQFALRHDLGGRERQWQPARVRRTRPLPKCHGGALRRYQQQRSLGWCR